MSTTPVEPLSAEPPPEPASIRANITYYLSEKGRRDSLRQGGDGRRLQSVDGWIQQADLDAFIVDEDGKVSFDLTQLHGCDPDFNPAILPPASKGRVTADYVMEWDVVPDWEALLAVVRGFKTENDDMEAANSDARAREDRVAEAFLKDPTARASHLERDSVKIAGERFYNDHEAAVEARRRWNSDQEELKNANRATLADWIGVHGTDNQRQRLWAGLLPWKEAYSAVDEYLFKPLRSFALYTRFEISEICLCAQAGGAVCAPKFQSIDATELTADEWEQFARIKSAVPGADFQLREHRAQCLSAAEPEIRRGVIVKFTLGKLAFKREFALGQVPF